MLPYIFAEKNGIHIIDLNKTMMAWRKLQQLLKSIAKSGKKIMFVATKKQAKEIVAEAAAKGKYAVSLQNVGLVVCLPTSATIRKSVKKMLSIEKNAAGRYNGQRYQKRAPDINT